MSPERRRQILRKRLGITAAVALLAGSALAALLIYDGFTVSRELFNARDQVLSARDQLANGDTASARQSLAQSRAHLRIASGRTNRLLWQAAERLPIAGRSFSVVSRVVDVADAASLVGRDLADRMEAMIGPGGQLSVTIVNGQVQLQPLREISDAVDAVNLSSLASSLSQLRASPISLIPVQLRDARAEAIDLGQEALDAVSDAGNLLTALPGFLGGDSPRRYFLAMQNPSELRGTGGLIGFFAVLTAENGRLQMTEPEAYEALDLAADPGLRFDPVPVSEEFDRRYAQANAAGFLANVNLDADFPTVAKVILDIYESRTGVALDGVVAIDPVGLGHIAGPIGPIMVPSTFADRSGQIPNPLPADRVAAVTMIDAYDVFGGPSRARKDYLKELAIAAFNQIFDGQWDPVPVARRLAETAGTGHLRMYSRHVAEQEAFRRLDIAGSLEPIDSATDLIAVTGNNLAANKSDVHVAHEIDIAIKFTDDDPTFARRHGTVTVAVINPMPAEGHDIYILGSQPISTSESATGFIGPRALNRTWFTVWTRSDNVIAGPVDSSIPLLSSSQSEIHGHRAFDQTIEIPSLTEASFTVPLRGPAHLRREGPDLIYDLTLVRQPKAIPDRIVLDIETPDGWTASSVDVEGGGDGSGMGPFGEPGPPLEASIGNELVRLSGDSSATIRVQVRYTRSVLTRFADWLTRPRF